MPFVLGIVHLSTTFSRPSGREKRRRARELGESFVSANEEDLPALLEAMSKNHAAVSSWPYPRPRNRTPHDRTPQHRAVNARESAPLIGAPRAHRQTQPSSKFTSHRTHTPIRVHFLRARRRVGDTLYGCRPQPPVSASHAGSLGRTFLARRKLVSRNRYRA